MSENLKVKTKRVLVEEVLLLVGEDVLGVEDLGVDADFFDNGLDSMAIMQLLILLEEKYGVSIPVESISRENFSSAETIVALLIERGVEVEVRTENVEVRMAGPAKVAAVVDTDASFEWLQLRDSDHFPLAFDASLRNDGQSGHIAHTFVELETVPDVERLRVAIDSLPGRFPILTARVRKRGLGLPYWVPAEGATPLLFEVWTPGENFEDEGVLLHEIVNGKLRREKDEWHNVRFHLVKRRDGGCLFVSSWSHLAMDGVGAELFVTELGRIVDGGEPVLRPYVKAKKDPRGMVTRWKATLPMVKRFYELQRNPFDCLPPKDLKQGKLAFEVFTLTKEQTAETARRAASICGPLVQMPFHLACVMRAHAAAFDLQGRKPASLMSNVPIQTRSKGTAGPVFQNHLTMFFGTLAADELGSWEDATRKLFEQHTTYVKEKLGEAFGDMMWMMRWMPPGLHMKFVKRQMKGLFCSFFHSHTGEFAEGMETFAGAKVTNGWHVPGLASPPGTGFFGSEHKGRLTITFCENCGAIGEDERKTMIKRLFEDYCGEEPPEAVVRGGI
jgi:acyl carrier protein